MASENNHHVARVNPTTALMQPLLSGLQHLKSWIGPSAWEKVSWFPAAVSFLKDALPE